MTYNVPLGDAIEFNFDEVANFDGNNVELELNPPYSLLNFNFDEIANFNGNSVDLEFAFNTDEDSGIIYDPPIAAPNPLFSVFTALPIDGLSRLEKLTALPVQTSQNELNKKIAISLDKGTITDTETDIPWGSVDAQDKQSSLAWEFPQPAQIHTSMAWGFPEKADNEIALTWGKLSESSKEVSLNWGVLHKEEKLISMKFMTALTDKSASLSLNIDGMTKLEEHHSVMWGDQSYSTICSQLYVPPESPDIVLNFDSPLPSGLDFTFDSSDYPLICDTREPSGERYYPYDYPDIVEDSGVPTNEIQDVYFIMHSIDVVVLPARTSIDIESVSLRYDIDSFAWTLTMGVLDGVTLIRPDENGNKEVEVNIDGRIFIFIVDGYSENRQFADSTWTVSGKSRTYYLAAPYKLPISHTYTSALNAAQIIDSEISGSGFTCTYSTVDWLVDANAFSYQNLSTMQAIRRVADAVGGVIRPHKADKSFIIQPRYVASPWVWDVTVPVASITSDVITNMTPKWSPKADIDGVYVSGNNIGVDCFVKRTGTAGSSLAAQFIDNLITTADVGREKGRNIISDRGSQEVIDIELPVLPIGQTPDIYDAGDLLEIQEDVTWKGMVIGISINATVNGGSIDVWQTVSLERHYGNN